MGTDAFQEIDTCGMATPITKRSFLVRSAKDLLTIVPQAFEIAKWGRPGPVLIDVPRDVQLEKIDILAWPEPGKTEALCDIRETDIQRIAVWDRRFESVPKWAVGRCTCTNSFYSLFIPF